MFSKLYITCTHSSKSRSSYCCFIVDISVFSCFPLGSQRHDQGSIYKRGGGFFLIRVLYGSWYAIQGGRHIATHPQRTLHALKDCRYKACMKGGKAFRCQPRFRIFEGMYIHVANTKMQDSDQCMGTSLQGEHIHAPCISLYNLYLDNDNSESVLASNSNLNLMENPILMGEIQT